MNVKEELANLKQHEDLVFLLAVNGDEGQSCEHGQDFSAAVTAAISAYHGSPLECPSDEPVNEDTINKVESIVLTLKQSSTPFVLVWYLPGDEVARLDCSGDINVKEELLACLTDELQDVLSF